MEHYGRSLGRAPLMWTVSGGYEDVVKQLLQLPRIKADINMVSRNITPETALSSAVRRNSNIVKMLLEVDGVIVDPVGRARSSFLTSREGRVEVVALLLQWHNADLNARDACDMTALAHAAVSKEVQVVEVMLKHNRVDLNARDDLGRTILAQLIVAGDYY
ncbi:ankyrin repeat-containing domain protein [Desarmillaria ectypa]|nr:ankyrin repeat-containing domain protein [Desarmillaria ectypa]